MMDRSLRVLTFNWHEPYICMLAGTGYELLVYEPVMPSGRPRVWNSGMRPLPENVKVVGKREMERQLDDGPIDLIIAHNVKDLMEVSAWRDTPKILVFHNKLTTEAALTPGNVDIGRYRARVKSLTEGVEKVFISPAKMQDWAVGDGKVILPGINVNDYRGYDGELKAILCVGNMLRERDLMMGYTEMERILKGLPSTLLGDNPTLHGRLSNGWDDLRNHYRKCRVYLNTLKHPYEDGYNLSLLEAMATGMPVLSLENPTSPVTDGVEGYISSDPETLGKRAVTLLEDRGMAMEMGMAARETVARMFPVEQFMGSWRDVIEKTARKRASTGRRGEVAAPPASVWMDYAYYPVTTAHYLRRAFARTGPLLTSGSSITDEIIRLWNLENMKAPVLSQDIPRSAAPDASSIARSMPTGFSPEFFLWVDTGLELPPAGLENLSIPRAAYFIDTHLHLENHLRMAASFDVVFLAQRKYVDIFRERGIRSVHWLPLACDPEIHGKKEVKVLHDIGFAGSITPSHKRRRELLERLARRFGVEVRRVFLEEMAELFSSSRIVFNNAIKDDLNMRVFEALCSGSLLLTDDADGLGDFFRDGEHLAVYSDENLEETAAYYLGHYEERSRIAEAGRREVLERHTYGHRADQMVRAVREAKRECVSIASDPGAGSHYYRIARTDIAGMVPEHAVRVLEVGCAAGITGKLLKEMKPGREVVGIENNAEAASAAAKHLDRVFSGDVETMEIPYEDGYFDCIIYADVLEHLREPEATLKRHRRLLSPGGVMLMSIPNIQHFSVLSQLVEGRFTYRDEGLLDRTHLRFFTLHEIREMLNRCGLSELEVKVKTVGDAYRQGAKGTLRIGRWQVDGLDEREMLGFFAFQYLLTAAPAQNRLPEEKEPFDPGFFADMLKEAGVDITAHGGTSPEKLAEGDENRDLYLGHINMALGRFKEAKRIYDGVGNGKYSGCALAAMGLLYGALRLWWLDRDDPEALEWFTRYSGGASNPEKTALAALMDGRGVELEPLREEPGEINDLDYICSFHALEEHGDVVDVIERWRNRLRDGGVLALVLWHSSFRNMEVSSRQPAHRFTPRGFGRLVKLIGGFTEVHSEEILPGCSFVVVLQKGENALFDYTGRLNALLAERAAERAAVYREKGLIAACMESARAALELDPENCSAMVRLADSLLKEGNAAGARGFYEKAVALGHDDSPYIGLGTISLMESDYDSARRAFEKGISMNPDNDRALCGLGMALFHGGERAEGMNFYLRALEKNPENSTALASLLQAAYALERYEEAEKAMESYLELHPANLDMLFGYAGLLFRRGKIDDAREVLEKMLLLDPDNEDAAMLSEKINGAGLHAGE